MFYRTITTASAIALYFNSATRTVESCKFTAKLGESREKAEKRLKENSVDGLVFIQFDSWNEVEEPRYMEESVFIAHAVKLEKPDPKKVTRTIKADIMQVYTAHRFMDEFYTVEVVLKAGIKGKERERAIRSAIQHDCVVRRVEKVGEIADLYGMDLELFISLSKTKEEID